MVQSVPDEVTAFEFRSSLFSERCMTSGESLPVLFALLDSERHHSVSHTRLL